jgi:hypothetical protein
MIEPLPILMEKSIEIDCDYLERTGELGVPHVAAQFLANKVETMLLQGERRRLILSNRAISAYQAFLEERTLTLV